MVLSHKFRGEKGRERERKEKVKRREH